MPLKKKIQRVYKNSNRNGKYSHIYIRIRNYYNRHLGALHNSRNNFFFFLNPSLFRREIFSPARTHVRGIKSDKFRIRFPARESEFCTLRAEEALNYIKLERNLPAVMVTESARGRVCERGMIFFQKLYLTRSSYIQFAISQRTLKERSISFCRRIFLRK